MLKKLSSVIEIEKSDTKPGGSEKELRGHILSLQNHPGFEELLRRMRLSRALLRSRLERPDEDDKRHYLRGLIEAYGYLERQLKQEVGRPVEEPRTMYAEEEAEYERLQQFVELIGRGGAN